MIDQLYFIDASLFHFINQSLATSVGDVVWPLITDYDKHWPIRVVLIGIWLWLLVKGGARGRTAALILIPLLAISDQISSSLIKPFIGRIRPCHVFPLDEIHLIVGCSGFSFPSSHAVNNFAVATMFSLYFPKIRAALYTFASLVAISRVFVGVHYPSDALGGAVIGTCIAIVLVMLWKTVTDRFLPRLAIERSGK